MDKPPTKRSPSSPLRSSDPAPKQPKIPRLDLVAPEVLGTGPSSVANSSPTTAMADSIPADDTLTLTLSRHWVAKNNFAMALYNIVQNENDKSVFDGCGWNDMQEIERAIARNPELKPLVVHYVETGTLEPLRAKAFEVIRRARNININGMVPMVENSDAKQSAEEAWKTEYQGDSSKLFVRALHTMNKNRTPAFYTNSVSIIQSSGMGKSRMVDEAAKMIFTLPFNLRSDADKSAYPLPNIEVRDFLTAGVKTMFRNDLEIRYLYFFKELFDQVNAELSSLERCESYEAFASAWYNEFTKERQKGFYKTTVQKSLVALKDRPTGEASTFYTTVEASVQALLETIVNKSSGKKETDLSKGGARQFVRLMLYFDESHELVRDSTKANDEENSRTAYQVLCRSLNSVYKEDVFVVHVSTDLSLNHSSLHMGYIPWNYTGPVAPDNLQVPFVELPFDTFVKVKEGNITLEQVSAVTHMAQFGRPLFHTIPRSGEGVDMIYFAKQKIYGTVSRKTVDGQLAALSIRMLFEFEPRRELARDKEAELVAGHMRVVYSVPKHRHYIRSGTPSEPLLAEAAAHIMMDNATKTLYVEDTIQRLAMFLNHGLISKGERGELVGRLILTLAHDMAILSTQPKNPRFSEAIGVLAFLEALVSPPYFERIKKSKPANVFNGATLEDAFANAELNFTHFVKGGDGSIISDEVAWMALARCMAFACANGQRTIDVYIPVLLWDEKLSRWVVSGIFIQFNNRIAAEKVTIDATDLKFFTHADPREFGKEEAARYNTRPYITIVMNMGVTQDRPKKRPKATRVHTSPMPEGPAGRKDSPSEVNAESGPGRERSQRHGHARSIHPRYAINIIGCSPNVYKVIPSKDSIAHLLASQDILDEHPRSGDYIAASLRLKPFWSRNANSFHWADVPNEDDDDDDDDEVEGVFVDGVDESDSDVDMG